MFSIHFRAPQTAITFQNVPIADDRVGHLVLMFFASSSGFAAISTERKPILISVIASGYKMTTVQSGGEVILSPSERREVEINLQHE